MEEAIVKKPRKTPEERIALIDEKIKEAQADIEKLEEKRAVYDAKINKVRAKISTYEMQKKAILTPKPPRKTKRQKISEMVSLAEKKGLKLEDIAERLGIELPK